MNKHYYRLIGAFALAFLAGILVMFQTVNTKSYIDGNLASSQMPLANHRQAKVLGVITPWSQGYWAPWASPNVPISDIDWSAWTHVMHVAAEPQADGTLNLTNQNIAGNAAALISAAHSHGAKVLLDIWTGNKANWRSATSLHMTEFVSNIMSVVNTYGYDGVDLDWEPLESGVGSPTNGQLMASLSANLKAQLGSRLLTAAVEPNEYPYWSANYANFDRINVMTYDMSGTWDGKSWFNSALYNDAGDTGVWSLELAKQRFLSRGMPSTTLGLGWEFGGWEWACSGPRISGCVRMGNEMTTYQAIKPLIAQRPANWDSQARVPWLGGNTFFSYENASSTTDKVNYVRDNNLGGWVVWHMGLDYFPNENPKQPLALAISNAIGKGGGATGSAPVINSATSAAGIVGAAFSYQITATNSPTSYNAANLPTGLTVNTSTGVISGTPAVSGTYSIGVSAINSYGNGQATLVLVISANSGGSSANLALGIIPTAGEAASEGSLSMLTDGNKDSLAYATIGWSSAQWVRLDLGKQFAINQVKLWHYYLDGRTYHDVVVQLSNDINFNSGVTTVFNNDTDNTLGFGAGSNQEYAESSAGKSIVFSPVAARYVRFWANTNSLNAGNHYVEVEVYGSSGTTADTQAPTVPSNLTASAISSSSINLSWAASTDNVGVAGYKVFRNGSQIAAIASTSYQDTGLAANTTYTYTVSAYDNAGNASVISGSVSATTQSVVVDNIPPTVLISSPMNGITLGAGTTSVSVKAKATDNTSVVKMEVYINNALKATASGSAASYSWNVRKVARGAYTILVKAYDNSGNVGSSFVTVYK